MEEKTKKTNAEQCCQKNTYFLLFWKDKKGFLIKDPVKFNKKQK